MKVYLWAGSPVAEVDQDLAEAQCDLKLVIFLPLEWLGLQATIFLLFLVLISLHYASMW